MLLHRPYFHGDFVYLAGKGSLRADADTLGDRCLIVEANLVLYGTNTVAYLGPFLRLLRRPGEVG